MKPCSSWGQPLPTATSLVILIFTGLNPRHLSPVTGVGELGGTPGTQLSPALGFIGQRGSSWEEEGLRPPPRGGTQEGC